MDARQHGSNLNRNSAVQNLDRDNCQTLPLTRPADAKSVRDPKSRSVRRAHQKGSILIQKLVRKCLERRQLVRTRIDIRVQPACHSNQNEFVPASGFADNEPARGALGKVFASAKSMVGHDAAAFFTTVRDVLRPVTVKPQKRK